MGKSTCISSSFLIYYVVCEPVCAGPASRGVEISEISLCKTFVLTVGVSQALKELPEAF